MAIELKENERLDDLQRNGLQIIQKTDGFCFGMDAVLLSGFAAVKPGAGSRNRNRDHPASSLRKNAGRTFFGT